MSFWTDLSTPIACELVVGIYDLTHYTLHSERTSPLALLDLVGQYHGLVADKLEHAGGRFLKPIGDAGLFAFRIEDTDRAVEATDAVLEEGDAWLAANGYPGRARFALHAGPVALGHIGPNGRKILDVIGKTVNIVARVRSYRLTITPAVFRRLSPEMRQQFRKHTPPIGYIRRGDPRPRDYIGGFEGQGVVS